VGQHFRRVRADIQGPTPSSHPPLSFRSENTQYCNTEKPLQRINGANVFCFLSSFPIPVISLLCIARAGVPIHIIGEVSCEPKRRRAWASQYLIPRCKESCILKGLSHEIDFDNIAKNLQMQALKRAAAGF
jgi:hypothetical protein